MILFLSPYHLFRWFDRI